MEHAADLELVPPVPPGTRLLHIGPPKTGSTALQAAFHRARSEVLRQGVRYAGRKRHSRSAVMAATGAVPTAMWNPIAGRRGWDRIVSEVRAARESRIFFSSERLSHADSAAIRTIVDAFGAEQVRIAVTVRPLFRILPAQWQQAVQAGLQTSLDDWLRSVLGAADDDAASLWFRHRHDLLVRRWSEVVGMENVTVIALDEVDRSMLLRTFERLLALEEGTLQAHRDLSNRSLTLPEAEAIRALNRELHGALSPRVRRRLLELGAIFHMRLREPAPDWAPIRLPAWATDQVATIADATVSGIESSGVRLIGDLAALRGSAVADAGRATAGDEAGPVAIPPAVVASLGVGLLAASGVPMRHRDASHGDIRAFGRSKGPLWHLPRSVVRRAVRAARALARRLRP